MESVLRTAFLLSESVHLTILDLGMCRRPEYNEISLKFLCFKELREQYRMEQMYAAQSGESGHDVSVFWVIDFWDGVCC